jgi:hypothetical protein
MRDKIQCPPYFRCNLLDFNEKSVSTSCFVLCIFYCIATAQIPSLIIFVAEWLADLDSHVEFLPCDFSAGWIRLFGPLFVPCRKAPKISSCPGRVLLFAVIFLVAASAKSEIFSFSAISAGCSDLGSHASPDFPWEPMPGEVRILPPGIFVSRVISLCASVDLAVLAQAEIWLP